mmetsp:Transcript_13961/g.18654  ORF Transcript_13961/g.18654 Transcript_13961/m.18654 type:complete len:223 (+) Transcript_13961:3-671(+)
MEELKNMVSHLLREVNTLKQVESKKHSAERKRKEEEEIIRTKVQMEINSKLRAREALTRMTMGGSGHGNHNDSVRSVDVDGAMGPPRRMSQQQQQQQQSMPNRKYQQQQQQHHQQQNMHDPNRRLGSFRQLPQIPLDLKSENRRSSTQSNHSVSSNRNSKISPPPNNHVGNNNAEDDDSCTSKELDEKIDEMFGSNPGSYDYEVEEDDGMYVPQDWSGGPRS